MSNSHMPPDHRALLFILDISGTLEEKRGELEEQFEIIEMRLEPNPRIAFLKSSREENKYPKPRRRKKFKRQSRGRK